MPEDGVTTAGLILMTMLSLVAWGVMWLRLAGKSPSPISRRVQYVLTGTCTTIGVALYAYRTLVIYGSWQPLQAHVDGLLLMAVLLAAAVLFLQSDQRLPEFSGFALPVLSLILLWSVCASWWTLQPFEIETIWLTFHLGSVYLGTISVAVAAAAGGMFLHVQKRLHDKTQLPAPGRFGSLETMERMIVTASTLGFALVTVGLITGLVAHTADPSKLGAGWWYTPKIVLAFVVWLVFALLMNVRRAALFRGRRAAWLSIAGLVLMLATMGAAL